MSELRWSLLILGVAFIAALGWWEWRRPRQARAGDATLRMTPRGPGAEAALPRPPWEPAAEAAAPGTPREPPLELPEIHARGPLATDELPVLEIAGDPEDEPVESDAALEDVAGEGVEAAPPSLERDPPIGELPVIEPPPLEAQPEVAVLPQPEPAVPSEPDPAVLSQPEPAAAPNAPELPRDKLPELPAAAAPVVEWPPDPERRVVALRLVATQPASFAGRSLRQALAAEGFVLGKFAIFHKPDEEQRAVLSAASLSRPGTFDAETMDSQHYGGLSLFAVLPGPHPPPQAFEELVTTARSLNQRLQGVLQDEAGFPLTPARIAILREHLGRETPA